jgi:hypothetical protein
VVLSTCWSFSKALQRLHKDCRLHLHSRLHKFGLSTTAVVLSTCWSFSKALQCLRSNCRLHLHSWLRRNRDQHNHYGAQHMLELFKSTATPA